MDRQHRNPLGSPRDWRQTHIVKRLSRYGYARVPPFGARRQHTSVSHVRPENSLHEGAMGLIRRPAGLLGSGNRDIVGLCDQSRTQENE